MSRGARALLMQPIRRNVRHVRCALSLSHVVECVFTQPRHACAQHTHTHTHQTQSREFFRRLTHNNGQRTVGGGTRGAHALCARFCVLACVDVSASSPRQRTGCGRRHFDHITRTRVRALFTRSPDCAHFALLRCVCVCNAFIMVSPDTCQPRASAA